MQLLVFCGHHPINTAADWWSLQQLSAAPWHVLYTQIQMFTSTCGVCCLERLEDFWVTVTRFTWCFGHNNLKFQHDGMKSIMSVSSLAKNFFDSWKIRSLSWKFHDFCLMTFATRAGKSSISVESEKINCQQEGGTANRSSSLLCLPHTTAESGSETMMRMLRSQIYPLYSALQQLHRHKERNHYSEPRPVNRPATWGARQLCRGPMRREVRGQERGQGVGGVFKTGGPGRGGRGGGLMSIKLCVIFFSPH